MNEIQIPPGIAGNLDQYTQRLADDYTFFIQELWKDRGLDSKGPLRKYELEMCEFASGPERTKLILAPRGIGKTYFISAGTVVHRLFRDPDWKILLVSKSEFHAKRILLVCAEWIRTTWFLQHLMPRQNDPDQRIRNSAIQLDVGPSEGHIQASVTAIGIDGQLPSNRANTIVLDDVETGQNTLTLETRDKLAETCKEFDLSILYPDLPSNPYPNEVVGVGTYWHEDSTYLRLHERGYKARSWPISTPQREDRILNLAPSIADDLENGTLSYTTNGDYAANPLFPHRFDHENVLAKMAGGRSYFAMQHMLLCDLADEMKYPLRLEDLIVFECGDQRAPADMQWGRRNSRGSTQIDDIECLGFGGDKLLSPIFVEESTWEPYTTIKAHIDTAGRGDDEFAVAVGGQLNGTIFAIDLWAFTEFPSSEVLRTKVCEKLRYYGVRDLTIETNFAGGFFQDTFIPILQEFFLKPGDDEAFPEGWSCTVREEHASSRASKEERIIEALEPVMGTHRLVVHPRVITPEPNVPVSYQLQHQLTRIKRERRCLVHDDRLDALAGLVNDWQHALRTSPSKASQNSVNRDAEAAYEAYLRFKAHNSPEPKKKSILKHRTT